MLAKLIGFARGAGLQAEWLVIRGDPDFFAVTKRIHNGLYGSPGDGADLGSRERSAYDRTTTANLDLVRDEIREGDVVIVHDPQPAGLIGPLVDRGRGWCGAAVGRDGANSGRSAPGRSYGRRGEPAHARVLARVVAPAWIDRAWLRAIPPRSTPRPRTRGSGRRETLGL
jgi:trehalose synthase